MPAITKPTSGRGDVSRELKAKLGAYIRGLREAKGLTQRELAQITGMNYFTAISAIEVGRNVVPPERYYEFAAALDVEPKAFMKRILGFTNPWAHAMLFSERPDLEINRLNKRFADERGR